MNSRGAIIPVKFYMNVPAKSSIYLKDIHIGLETYRNANQGIAPSIFELHNAQPTNLNVYYKNKSNYGLSATGISKIYSQTNSSDVVSYSFGAYKFVNNTNSTARVYLNNITYYISHFNKMASKYVHQGVGILRVDSLLSGEQVVTDFADTYLHMSDIPTSNGSDTGACKGVNRYYAIAKQQLLNLDSECINKFRSSTFNTARARYESWATLNNDSGPYANNVSNTPIINDVSTEENNPFVYVIFGLCGVIIAGAVFIYVKKRKHLI